MGKPPRMDADMRVLFDFYMSIRDSLSAEEARGFDSFCRINGIVGPHHERAVRRHEPNSLNEMQARWQAGPDD